MALGFTFTEYDEWRMLVCKDRAKKFMRTFGGAKPTDHIPDVTKMVVPQFPPKAKVEKKRNTERKVEMPLAPKIDMTRNPMWKRIIGVRGYMFAIVNGELKCINAYTEREIEPQNDKSKKRYYLCNQETNRRDKSCAYGILKLAFCLKYNLSVNDSRLLGRHFIGTVDEPKLKKSNEDALWDILHIQE